MVWDAEVATYQQVAIIDPSCDAWASLHSWDLLDLANNLPRKLNILLDTIYIHQIRPISHRNMTKVQHHYRHVYERQILAKYTMVIPITTGGSQLLLLYFKSDDANTSKSLLNSNLANSNPPTWSSAQATSADSSS